MISKRKTISTYNDGIFYVYKENNNNITDFNAKKNVRSINDMTKVCCMAYSENSQRIEDVEFAERMSQTLSLKVCTRYNNQIKKNHKIVINNHLYNILKMDPSREKQELYLYLTEVRELEKC